MKTATFAKAITFEQAKAMYVHRFTMEHIPAWALEPLSDGRYCAPQYGSDAEWYNLTEFPTDRRKKYCESSGQTWPLGQFLDKPYAR